MDKVYVVYWSQSGNTQAMAEAIGKGITAAGKEAAVQFVSEASVEDLKNVKGFALGCPAMGVEGAALATTLSKVISFLAAVCILFFGKTPVSIQRGDSFRPDIPILKRILKIGITSGMERSMERLPVPVPSAIWGFVAPWKSLPPLSSKPNSLAIRRAAASVAGE